MERRARTVDLRRIERAGVSRRHEGLAALARVAAQTRCKGRAIRPAASVDGLGQGEAADIFRAGRRCDGEGGRDGPGAGRRELAAPRLRRRMGRRADASRYRRLPAEAGQLRLRGRLVGTLQASCRTAVEAHRPVVRRWRHARRSDHLRDRDRGRRDLCARACPARRHRDERRSHAAHRAAARYLGEGARTPADRTARQAIGLDLPAQGAQPLARRDRLAARGHERSPFRAGARRTCAAGERRADPPHRHRADRARHLDGGRHRVRRDRRAVHAAPAARRVRGGRNARLGSADRRLFAASLLCDRRRGRTRRARWRAAMSRGWPRAPT